MASCGGEGSQLPPIAATPGAVGAATLSWQIPTERTDGSPLTNLAGFSVYWGLAPGLYTNNIDIDNPSINLFVVEPLDTGNTYYFAVQAYDANNLSSDFSNEASKTID